MVIMAAMIVTPSPAMVITTVTMIARRAVVIYVTSGFGCSHSDYGIKIRINVFVVFHKLYPISYSFNHSGLS
jgi:hypothetical protein